MATLRTPNGVFEYNVTHSARRSLHLKVTADTIQIRAPLHTASSSIEQFIHHHAEWIVKTRQRLECHRALPINQWAFGQTIQYLGYRLCLASDPQAIAPRYVGDYQNPSEGDCLYLPIASDASTEQIKKHAQYWLENRARQWFSERLLWFAHKRQIQANGWRISRAHTRWGQCNSRGIISLNWRLIHFPKEQIDYVIAHELAHLRQMNHSPKFWAEVARLMPEYESIKQAMRAHRIESCD